MKPITCLALALPDPYLLGRLISFGSIVEIGAGRGVWGNIIEAYGGDWRGFDINPGGGNVWYGDHRLVAKNYGDCTMLAVWPPDTLVIEWLLSAPWPRAIFVGICAPIVQEDISPYRIVEEYQLAAGVSGGNHVYVLE